MVQGRSSRTSVRRAERGFTLLLAALVSSIVLALGAAIYALAVKELELSSLGRDSQYAFFAADTGAECALYWDIRHDFASTTAPTSPITCAGNNSIAVTHTALTPYPVTFNFQFESSGYCTAVSVTKSQSGSIISTTIHADGYSASCANYTTNNRTLQRSVELHY